MEGKEKPSVILQISAVVLFILFSIGALIAFGYYTFQLAFSFVNQEDIIAFNKGAMYMLGVGLSSGLLTYFMIYEIIKKEISVAFNKKATRSALIFMGLIFILPQIFHYSLEYILEKRGYMICDLDSYQWRMYRTFYYVSSVDACTNLIESKK